LISNIAVFFHRFAENANAMVKTARGCLPVAAARPQDSIRRSCHGFRFPTFRSGALDARFFKRPAAACRGAIPAQNDRADVPGWRSEIPPTLAAISMRNIKSKNTLELWTGRRPGFREFA
jgi:hypothetical protein